MVDKKEITNAEKSERRCDKPHVCHCGMHSSGESHLIGTGGCTRRMVAAPVPAPDDEELGKMWQAEGSVITDYTLRFQRYYNQHECGCWSRNRESVNSLSMDGEPE